MYICIWEKPDNQDSPPLLSKFGILYFLIFGANFFHFLNIFSLAGIPYQNIVPENDFFHLW